MRKFIIIFFSLILANCSLNKDSQYWTENTIESKTNQKKLNEILKKSDDITVSYTHLTLPTTVSV